MTGFNTVWFQSHSITIESSSSKHTQLNTANMKIKTRHFKNPDNSCWFIDTYTCGPRTNFVLRSSTSTCVRWRYVFLCRLICWIMTRHMRYQCTQNIANVCCHDDPNKTALYSTHRTCLLPCFRWRTLAQLYSLLDYNESTITVLYSKHSKHELSWQANKDIG